MTFKISEPHTKLTPKEFKNYTYSKKSHFKTFCENDLDSLLLNRKIDLENCDIPDYQSLLVTSFILTNIKKGSRILQLGEKNFDVVNYLSNDYDCWVLKNPEELLNKEFFVSDSSIKKFKGEFNEINSGNFDFVFSVMEFGTQSGNSTQYQNFVSNLKSLTKPLGYILNCFVSVLLEKFESITSNKIIWHNKLYDYLNEIEESGRNGYYYGAESKDADLFCLPEEVYNKNWKTLTARDYNDFGKPFSNNILWQNRIYLSENNYQQFVYSKKSNIDFFIRNNFAVELLGNNPLPDNLSLEIYQCLLIYTFVESKIPRGSKILQIGKVPEILKNRLSRYYQVHEIPDVKELTESGQLSNKNNITILDTQGNNIVSPIEQYEFIYSISLDQIANDKKNYFSILNNLNRIKKPFALILFCFENTFFENIMNANNFLYYLFTNRTTLNYFISYANISNDGDLWLTTKRSEQNSKSIQQKDDISYFSYNVIWQDRKILPITTKTKTDELLKIRPAYIFHHIPKCGGTSVRGVLANWFRLIDDNIGTLDINDFKEKKYDLNKFDCNTCLTAHFQFEGIFLHERYPEVIERNKEFKIFTFIRDPLEFNISNYYYAKQIGVLRTDTNLAIFLKNRVNQISKLFPCDESNYKEVLDRYFFIGIVERMQESFDILASLIGKKKIKIPVINQSKKDSQVSGLTSGEINNFRNENNLDYLVYDYCVEKFTKIII